MVLAEVRVMASRVARNLCTRVMAGAGSSMTGQGETGALWRQGGRLSGPAARCVGVSQVSHRGGAKGSAVSSRGTVFGRRRHGIGEG